MSTWLIKINGAAGVSPESLDLVIVGGEWASARPSTVMLEAVTAFDGAEVFEYGDTIEITRDASPYFTGTVRAIPKSADGSGERQRYQVEDAWADLEKTIYQELWSDSPSTTVLLPMVYLGIDDTGVRITLGEQIEEVVAFAVAAGIDIQAGTIPTGMLLWPTKVTGMSCAEVIRTSLRFHPDWIPWLDHSFSPPKLEVTPRADATARTVAITAADQIDIVETSERVPDCIRICYLTASQDGETVLRTGAIDKYPALGDDSGPGVLTVAVDLAGSSAQIQKQQVQVRTIPVTADSDTDKKAYLKAKFPAIAGLDDADFDVTGWTTAVVTETETPPDEINPEAPRLVGTTLTHLPRELVKGAVHEWMRKRVGKVSIQFGVSATGTATDAEALLLDSLPQNEVIVTATNAITKIYKGIASWAAAEDAPAGIAQAYYETIANGCRYAGSVPLTESEVGATRYHGCKLHLSGGLTAWASMGAPIHTVTWNLQTRETVIGFGPNPDLSFGDFLEYLRQLARRPAQWMSGAERTSEELGDTAGPSAAGDNVGPADVPGTDSLPNPVTPRLLPYEVHSIRDDGGTWKCKVKTGYVQSNNPGYGASPIMVMPTPTSDETVELTVSTSHKIYCKVTTDTNDLPTASEIISASSPTSYHAQPTDTESGGAVGADGVYHYLIADFEEVSSVLVVKNIYHIGGSIIHRPGRNDRNFNLEVYGDDTYCFRQGLFVGDEDPESSDPGNLITAIVLGSA